MPSDEGIAELTRHTRVYRTDPIDKHGTLKGDSVSWQAEIGQANYMKGTRTKYRISFLSLFWILASSSSLVSTSTAQGATTINSDLSIRLDSATHLYVTGTVHLPASASPQATIDFVLADTMQHFKARVIEPKQYTSELLPGPAQGHGTHTKYTAQLPKAIPPGQTITLQFSCDSEGTPSFGYSLSPNVSFAEGDLTAWYPQFGQGGNSTGALHFSIPEGKTVVATGIEDTSTPSTFHIDYPARFTFAVAAYSKLHRAGTVPVTAYELRNREDTQQHLERWSQILDNLIKEFGPYPYHHFSVVEIPEEQAAGFAGASSPGLILVTSAALNSPFSLGYYAHEFSHQWWGDLVTTAEASQGEEILGEGLAQYGSLSTVEALEGEQAAETYRRTGAAYFDSGDSAHGYFKIAGAGLDHRLDTMPPGALSHNLADAKGFLVLDMLARTMGRDNFHRALQTITRDHAFGTLSWEQFLSSLQQHSYQDMSWFFQQWFSQSGAPDWQLQWKQQQANVSLSVMQPPPYYRLSVEVLLEGERDQTLTQAIHIEGSHTEVEIPVDFNVRRVTLDPHFIVLHWTPEFHAEAKALAGVTVANFDRIQGKREQARTEFNAAINSAVAPDVWGIVFESEVGLARLAMGEQNWLDAKMHFMNALSASTRPAEDLPWAYYRLANVAQHLNDDSLLRWAVAGTVTADSLLVAPTGAAVGVQAFLKAH